ncbi:class I SAM-dependent methyltransferase [Streptomyces sp. TRM66268-LWL]|uniref:Class I SAM-dependent methyltransferase n=1 Tax=Streptomyces polyasparticus TaxID=2767826 RepID=A0ABR7SCY9_9ACTN|nr:class I SAM-dependent methyltransferase [Streptomyces polyasparticus]MBC9713360.1 class I SAM-dependent methyltransferase [Streptomyces polyasparticus]
MTQQVHLGREQETLLMTLYLRAVDSGRARPVLGDPHAQRVMAQIDYDFGRLRGLRGGASLVAARARRFDAWTAEFLHEHPDAVVLHLACGLDSRPLRVARPASTVWIDVDYPEVVALRERVYGPVDGVRTVSASVTEPGWWDEVPADRPALVLAEGLLMYLSPDDVSRLVNRVVGHFPSGRLVFDAVVPWVRSVSGLHPALRRADTRFRWALHSPTSFARAHPPLRLLSDIPALDELGRCRRGTVSRTALRGLGKVPGVGDALRFVRYGFAVTS